MAAPRHVRPTNRGLALTGVGIAVLGVGALSGVEVMVQVGSLLLLTVGAGVGWLLLEARAQSRGSLRLVRRVTPHPVQVGERAAVEVAVTSSSGTHRLDRLQIAERASRELSGPTPLRARVQRAASSLTLAYTVEPVRRGRWAVGPLEVQRRDLFGTARWRGPLGEPMLIAVRPAVTRLAVTDSSASTDVDRAAVGSRTPAADDASLRDYRTGDDLRRVHWRSSARRGELMVRQDERSGRRPATVLLDIPQDDDAAEWSISLAASIALALMASGHHVRILGGGLVGSDTDHHRADTDGHGADALLDQTVDLALPRTLVEREQWFLAALDTLTAEAGGGTELVFAVVGGLEPRPLGALARIGDGSHGWVMVRTSTGTTNADEARTLEGLRRAGWTACAVVPGEDMAGAWDRLLGSDDRVAVAR